MRLLLDEMYPARLAEALRAAGADVVAVLEVSDLVGAADRDVLAWASAAGRVVVTENVRDFAPMAGEASGGLLLVAAARWSRKRSAEQALRGALLLRSSQPAEPGVLGWL